MYDIFGHIIAFLVVLFCIFCIGMVFGLLVRGFCFASGVC